MLKSCKDKSFLIIFFPFSIQNLNIPCSFIREHLNLGIISHHITQSLKVMVSSRYSLVESHSHCKCHVKSMTKKNLIKLWSHSNEESGIMVIYLYHCYYYYLDLLRNLKSAEERRTACSAQNTTKSIMSHVIISHR